MDVACCQDGSELGHRHSAGGVMIYWIALSLVIVLAMGWGIWRWLIWQLRVIMSELDPF